MNIKILFKDHGKGKERLVLVDTSNNRAFASFGNKEEPYKYLKELYDKEQAYLNRYQNLTKKQLNALHYDLSYDQAHTTSLNKQIEIGNEMRLITKIFNEKKES